MNKSFCILKLAIRYFSIFWFDFFLSLFFFYFFWLESVFSIFPSKEDSSYLLSSSQLLLYLLLFHMCGPKYFFNLPVTKGSVGKIITVTFPFWKLCFKRGSKRRVTLAKWTSRALDTIEKCSLFLNIRVFNYNIIRWVHGRSIKKNLIY